MSVREREAEKKNANRNSEKNIYIEMEYIHGGLVYVLFNMRARLHEQTVEFS